MDSKFLSFFTVTALLVSSLIASNANAEYYMVFSPPDSCQYCDNVEPYYPHAAPVIRHLANHHHRVHRSHNSYSLSVTYLGVDVYPVGPCNKVWVPYHCGCCGECREGHWGSRNVQIYHASSRGYSRSYAPGYDEWVDEPDKDMTTEDDAFQAY